MRDQTRSCQLLVIVLHVDAHQVTVTAGQHASMHMRMVCFENAAVHNSHIKQPCNMGFATPGEADQARAYKIVQRSHHQNDSACP